MGFTYSLHCSSFLGLLIGSYLYIWLNQKKGTTMETIGRVQGLARNFRLSGLMAGCRGGGGRLLFWDSV